MIELFTLPTCPICEMIKKKLNLKAVPYVERPFEDLPKELEVDRAPVLFTERRYLFSPTEINKWIEEV